MKRFSAFFILLSLLCLVVSLSLAQDIYTVKTRTARVRAEANTTSAVVATLRFGAELTVLEAVDGVRVSGSTVWYKVQLRNGVGYIHSSLVTAPATGAIAPNNSGGSSGGAVSTPAPDAPPVAPPQGVSCGGKTTCGQMDSCAQAYACLAAGRSSLDRDKDGVPCESICPGG